MDFKNLLLYQTINQIRDVINKAHLPIGVIYYIMQVLLQEIQELYEQTIEIEMQQYQLQQQSVAENQNDNNEEEHPLIFTTVNDKNNSGQE